MCLSNTTPHQSHRALMNKEHSIQFLLNSHGVPIDCLPPVYREWQRSLYWSLMLMIKTEEMTAQKPLPVWEAESRLHLAMLPHVAPRTDAHVSALAGLDAGGVACAGLRRAQACICGEAGKETLSKRVLVAMCSPASSFHVSVPIFSPCLRFHTLPRVHTTASCHREQNCELAVHRKAARLEEGCGASLYAEVNTTSTNRFCLMGHNRLLFSYFFKKRFRSM